MPYEIPQSLQYQEKIVFNLTLYQVAILSLVVIPIALIWFKTNFSEWLKWTLTIIFGIVGISFCFLDLAKWIQKIKQYSKENRTIAKGSNFIHDKLIQKIETDFVILKNGNTRAILKVKPIEFTWLSEHEQSAIIAGFRELIQSIDFPIQLCMKTTNWDELSLSSKIPTQFNHEEKRNYAIHYQKFISELKEKRKIKQREFYLVISGTNQTNSTESLFSIFSTPTNESKDNGDRLGSRCEWIKQKLESFGIQSRRLIGVELTDEVQHYLDNGV